MISEYIKITVWACFAMACYVGYDEVVRPYSAAYSETKEILIGAAIPVQEKASGKYREQSIAALKAGCTNGVYQGSEYDFHCSVDSPLPYISHKMFTSTDSGYGFPNK